ncbi:hypothetical protein GSI_04247 [Ganoderma sinense ZZ0214-1]|uniref:RING-type domain-containing protein n=1 Tax=Ganoderma sinense ZZ0214-1 TaxID=1077348 RepID=A0A2G8SIM9_9APHY|nr:hypothetical protein GSI_04247 [Ganoderma sinense ZZ0214-1]
MPDVHDDMHHFCDLCRSPFLVDTPTAAEAVAVTCGHVFHRDCVENRIAISRKPLCSICSKALPRKADMLRKVFLTYDESEYDEVLQKEVQSATRGGEERGDVGFEINQCQQRIEALREEQKFYEEVLRNMDAQLSSLHKLRDVSDKRLKRLTTQVNALEGEHRGMQSGN